MLLHSVILENIRSYQKEEVSFPRGITLFVGDMGSGKSSVMMAVEFALFGVGSQSPRYLLRKGENSCSVTLRFESHGKRYEVYRKLKRTKSGNIDQDSGYILELDDENAQKESLSAKELKPRVLQILDFNEPPDPKSHSVIYRYAIFTPQDEMKKILQDSSSKDREQRLETLRKAFRLEDYRVAADNAKELAKHIRHRCDILKERFSTIDQDRQTLQDTQDKHESSKERLESLDGIISSLQQKESEHKSTVSDLEKKAYEIEQVDRQLGEIDSQIKKRRKEISEFDDSLLGYEEELGQKAKELRELQQIQKPTDKSPEQLQKEIRDARNISNQLEQLYRQKAELYSAIDSLGKKLGEYKESSVSYAQAKLEQLQKEIDSATKKKEDLQRQHEDKNTYLHRIQAKIDDMHSRLEELQTVEEGAKCPICESKLSSDHKKKLEQERNHEIEKHNKELGKVKQEVKDISEKISELEKTAKNKEEEKTKLHYNVIPSLNDLEEKKNQLDELEKAKIPNLEEKNSVPYEIVQQSPQVVQIEQSDNLESYLLKLKEKLERYTTSQDRIKELNSYVEKIRGWQTDLNKKKQEYSQEIKELETKYSELEEKKKQQEDVNEQLKQANERLEEISGNLAERREEKASLKTQVEELESDLEGLKDTVEREEQAQGDHNTLSNYEEWISKFLTPVIGVIERNVMNSIWQDFNEMYTKWYSILVDDPSQSSRIDEDFTPLVEQDGYEQELAALSGGERTSIALAYRLALNSVMRKQWGSDDANLLILDEPTDGFSKNQLAKVRTLLNELESDQVILVSHESEMESFVDHIYRIEKTNGNSKIR